MLDFSSSGGGGINFIKINDRKFVFFLHGHNFYHFIVFLELLYYLGYYPSVEGEVDSHKHTSQ